MTEQNPTPQTKAKADEKQPAKASTAEAKAEPDAAVSWSDPEPEEVTLQRGDGPKVVTTKPSTEYTQLVNGYGYKEV